MVKMPNPVGWVAIFYISQPAFIPFAPFYKTAQRPLPTKRRRLSIIFVENEEQLGVPCQKSTHGTKPSCRLALLLFFAIIPNSSFQYKALCSRLFSTSISISLHSKNYIITDLMYCGVEGLSWSVDEKSLKDAFSSFGDVTEGKIETFINPNVESHFCILFIIYLFEKMSQ